MRLLFLFLLCIWQLSAEVVIKETTPDGSWLEARINDNRSLKELIFSDGSSVLYEYECARLQKIIRFDLRGVELYSHTYQWNDSRLVSQAGWFSTEYLYDSSGRIAAKLNPWLQETIEYNSQGYVARIGNKVYVYDSVGQITSEQGCFYALYDQNCNLTNLNGQSIFLNEQNQIEGFSYDEQGNTLREQFIYDGKSQLIEAVDKHYFYDAYGRRIQKEETSYLYLGFEEIASIENGCFKTLKIPGIGGPIAIEIDGKPYAPIIDAAGIVRKLIDPVENSLYAENHCDLFGEGITAAIPYAYRGKLFDPETGLIYFGRRYYDPIWHRWLTPDPLGPIDHENLYQYAYNNPLQYSDPIGASLWGYVLGIGEIAAGGALMLAGGVVEVGSFGTLTLGFAFAETTGVALIADGWSRAAYEAKDIQFPNWNRGDKIDALWKETTKQPPRFNGKDLGLDPSQCPDVGFEWRGKGSPESGKGNWVNPITGEKLHPDLWHPPGKDPHWGYTDVNGTPYDLFLDGSWD